MKNLICFFLVAFLTTTTFAQRKGMAKKVDATIEKMTTDLDLTAEQQVQIKAIYDSRPTMNKASRKEQTREERVAARTELNDQIEAVLTPAQVEKRNALMQDQKKNAKAGRGKNKAESSGKKANLVERYAEMTPETIEKRAVKSTNKLNRQVNLTEEQQVTVKASYLTFFQKNQAVATDASLDADAKNAMLKQVNRDYKSEINSLLTEEQIAARKANGKGKKAKGKKKEQN